ncbi:Hydroxyacylglutathione hydrolase [compost metagenome]
MTLKVADHWFDRRTFSDGITLLWEPHVHPMLRCNIWHVSGRERDLFVDTGMGVGSLRQAARDLLQKPVTAVATHSHLDHMGGLHEFDCRLCHAAESAAFAQPNPHDRLVLDEDHWLALYMPDLGPERLIIDALPHAGFDPAAWTLQPAPPTGFLRDNDVLDLGDRHFEVLHLPGHSPGSIALFEEATGTLFSGDVIYDGELLADIPGACLDDYVRSLERLRELPVRVVHAGHEGSFGRAALLEMIATCLAAWRA